MWAVLAVTGRAFAKVCIPHPGRIGQLNLRENMHWRLKLYTQERIAKICALRQNHTIPVWELRSMRVV